MAQCMAQPRSVLRVPASSLSFTDRLARQFPAKVNKNSVKSRSTRASIVKKKAPKRALTKELAALGIAIDEDEAPPDDDESHDPAKRRYELRGRDKSQKVSGSTRVTKTSSPKIVKVRSSYEGPGYLGKSPRTTKKGQDCTICAETQGR